MRFVIVATVLAGCGRLGFDAQNDAAQAIDDTPFDAACTSASAGPFMPPRNLTELNTASIEQGGMLTDDRLELYFSSDRPGGAGSTDLYVTTRSSPDGVFGAPTLIASLATAQTDDDPYVEPDGLTLWLQRGSSIMRSVRADRSAPWPPATVVTELDDPLEADGAITMTADRRTIYFSSQRAPTVGGTGFYDLWRATRPSPTAPFDPPIQEIVASSPSFDCCPHLLAGEMQVAFSSQRAGFTEIWIADRMPDGSLGVPSTFAFIDSPDPVLEFDFFATPDGMAMGMSSNRTGSVNGSMDLWLYERTCP